MTSGIIYKVAWDFWVLSLMEAILMSGCVQIHKKDGTLVYAYVLLYTDYCFVVSENAESILK